MLTCLFLERSSQCIRSGQRLLQQSEPTERVPTGASFHMLSSQAFPFLVGNMEGDEFGISQRRRPLVIGLTPPVYSLSEGEPAPLINLHEANNTISLRRLAERWRETHGPHGAWLLTRQTWGRITFSFPFFNPPSPPLHTQEYLPPHSAPPPLLHPRKRPLTQPLSLSQTEVLLHIHYFFPFNL